MKTFEQYLQDIFDKDYHGVKDDALDAFNVWVERLDTSEVMQYAESMVLDLNWKVEKLLIIGTEAAEDVNKNQ